MSLSSADDKTDIHQKEAASFEETHEDVAFEKATMRKVDYRLLPILGALYSIALIDRTNVSVARQAGMATDLQLTVGDRYSIITLVFFIPYIIFELPSNILLRKVGCRTLLSSICTAWGAVMCGMAFVTSYQQLAVLRTVLGLLESGFFPGCTFLIATWYKKYETGKRMALFYLTSMAVSGFSNIMGFGIAKMGGIAGLAAWRWIFLIFGIVTVALGLLAFFLIVDFPDKNNFLSEKETAFVINRINVERGDAEPDKLTLGTALAHLKDFKLWAFAVLFMCTTLPAYAFSYFLPIILSGGGFAVQTSLLLSAPPYISAAFYTFTVAFFSDKYHQRALFIGINATVAIVGLFIMAFGGPLGLRYFGSFLAIAGCQANVPAILTYSANNVLSHSKRAVSTALVIGFGGIGGIMASTVYRQVDYPRYLPGLGATIGAQGLILVILGALTMHFKKCNTEVDAGSRILEGRAGFKYSV